jgi:hypothetical protein
MDSIIHFELSDRIYRIFRIYLSRSPDESGKTPSPAATTKFL